MIKLEGIKKQYRSSSAVTNALDGIDLYISKNELAAVVGASGSGKSTLLNVIGGMDKPTSGKYFFNDESVTDYNISELNKFRKKNISFVFQNFALMNRYTVYENVEMPLLARKVHSRKNIIMNSAFHSSVHSCSTCIITRFAGICSSHLEVTLNKFL